MGDLTKDFSRWEFACNCGCGFDTIDYKTVEVLQDVRDHYDKKITVNSGCRCPYWNKHENGAEASLHMKSRAADFSVEGVPAYEVASYLEGKYQSRYAILRYNNFTHFDTRSGGRVRKDYRTP